MVAIVSKPGLTSASALAIPKDWSSTWYSSHISNLLQGADVRNAVGANGIKVSGTIASPYATISTGGPGTATFAQLVVGPPPSGTTLTVYSLTGQQSIIAGIVTASNNPRLFVTSTESTGETKLDFTGSSGYNGTIAVGGAAVMTLSNTRNVTINPPASGVALTVSGFNSGYAINVQNAAGVDTRGVILYSNPAGSKQYSAGIDTSGGGQSEFSIRDITASRTPFVIGTNGDVTINSPASFVTALTVNPAATGGGTTTCVIVTNNAVSTNIGMSVISGSNQNVAYDITSGSTLGAAFANYTTLNSSLVMNSSGANYGQIGNTGTQLWSTGSTSTGSGIGTVNNNTFTWGNTGSQIYFPGHTTTASAANAFINSASSPVGQLLRSTSSIRYKTNVTSLGPYTSSYDASAPRVVMTTQQAAAPVVPTTPLTPTQILTALRPVTYTSLADVDDKSMVHLGLIAEEVNATDPRLVQFGPDGSPDSVQYPVLAVLLIAYIQQLEQRLAAAGIH